MNIGNKIRELRKQRGITQEQLAESIGIFFRLLANGKIILLFLISLLFLYWQVILVCLLMNYSIST